MPGSPFPPPCLETGIKALSAQFLGLGSQETAKRPPREHQETELDYIVISHTLAASLFWIHCAFSS